MAGFEDSAAHGACGGERYWKLSRRVYTVPVKIALAQINPTVGDFIGNGKKIREFAERAALERPDLVVFPELAICGYPPADLLEKESFVARGRRGADGACCIDGASRLSCNFVRNGDAGDGCCWQACAECGGIAKRGQDQLCTAEDAVAVL